MEESAVSRAGDPRGGQAKIDGRAAILSRGFSRVPRFPGDLAAFGSYARGGVTARKARPVSSGMNGRVEIVNGSQLLLRDADGAGVTITFQRTLRIPDDGRTYPLPPGLGAFPLRLVRDYASRVPAGWAARGGVFLPMYQREAMWLSFGGAPRAQDRRRQGVRGERRALAGRACARPRRTTSSSGRSRGSTASPRARARSASSSRCRSASATPSRASSPARRSTAASSSSRTPPSPAGSRAASEARTADFDEECCTLAAPMLGGGAARGASGQMGLAAGGCMDQKIYPDVYGLDTWDQAAGARVRAPRQQRAVAPDHRRGAAADARDGALVRRGRPALVRSLRRVRADARADEQAGRRCSRSSSSIRRRARCRCRTTRPWPSSRSRLWWKHHPGAVIVDDGDW